MPHSAESSGLLFFTLSAGRLLYAPAFIFSHTTSMLTVMAFLALRRYVVAHPLSALRAAALLFLCLGQPVGGWAQGNLLLSPRRVVFEGQRRTMELNLANSGKDTARYAISLIEVRMKEDGQFQIIEDVDSAGPAIASPYVRFFPRTVTLAPNEAQTVKIQVVRTAELQPGEYRSHMYFRALANEDKQAERSEPRDTTSVSVSIKPVFGISIPVIIRVGSDSTAATISDAEFAGGDEPAVKVMLNRIGKMSVYGDLQVSHIAPDGDETAVGIAKGVAVYSTVPRRSFSLSLDKEAKVDWSRGSLRVTYTDGTSSKPIKLAETTLALTH